MLAIKYGDLNHFLRPGLLASDSGPGFDYQKSRKELEGIGVITYELYFKQKDTSTKGVEERHFVPPRLPPDSIPFLKHRQILLNLVRSDLDAIAIPLHLFVLNEVIENMISQGFANEFTLLG